MDADAKARIKLAGRILMQTTVQGGPPVTLNDIAELRFWAESDEERNLPPAKLAQIILEREQKRVGYPPLKRPPTLGSN